MPTKDEALDLFDRRRRAWLAEDVDGYLALWHEDMTIGTPTREVVGRDAYAELVRTSFASMAPVAFDFHHVFVDGDLVAAEWTIRARHRATDAPIEWGGMSICAFEGERIKWWREYWDPGALVP